LVIKLVVKLLSYRPRYARVVSWGGMDGTSTSALSHLVLRSASPPLEHAAGSPARCDDGGGGALMRSPPLPSPLLSSLPHLQIDSRWLPRGCSGCFAAGATGSGVLHRGSGATAGLLRRLATRVARLPRDPIRFRWPAGLSLGCWTQAAGWWLSDGGCAWGGGG
jgi:hypothetical protein